PEICPEPGRPNRRATTKRRRLRCFESWCESPYERDEASNKPRRRAGGWMLGGESCAMLLGNQRMGANLAPEPELSDGMESPADGNRDIRLNGCDRTADGTLALRQL